MGRVNEPLTASGQAPTGDEWSWLGIQEWATGSVHSLGTCPGKFPMGVHVRYQGARVTGQRSATREL